MEKDKDLEEDREDGKRRKESQSYIPTTYSGYLACDGAAV
jgi:hypothetical protein